MYNEIFVEQVKLLLTCLPIVSKQTCFALKGGTAINLFLHNMPRLSVDIDLTYLPIKSREYDIEGIQQGLINIRDEITKIHNYTVQEQRSHKDNLLLKLIVQNEKTNIKIEPNFILRGALYPIDAHDLCSEAQQTFDVYIVLLMLNGNSYYQ